LASATRSATERAGARLRHHQDVVECEQRGDRLEVLDRIELQVGIERRVDRVGAGVPHHQLIAVGRRVLDRHRGDIAAGARPVLDDEGVAGIFCHPLRSEPHDDVGTATRRERHHDGDRAGGIVVGLRHRVGGDENAQQRGK
jgi:hypothetical protein